MSALGFTPRAERVPGEVLCRAERCTLYTRTAFGFRRIECRRVIVRRFPDGSRSAEFTAKHRRFAETIPDGKIGAFVVLAGYGHPELGAGFRIDDLGHAVSLYPSHSSQYDHDFGRALRDYAAAGHVRVLHVDRMGS